MFQSIKHFICKHKKYVPFVFLGIIFFLFPNNNPTGDAYAYAYSALSGKEIFYPHHLLHCGLGYIVLNIFKFLPLEPLYILQSLNILIGLLTLFFLRKILLLNNVPEKTICYLLIFCGACFSFIRFTIDYETYILPVCLSMIVIYYMQKIFSKDNKINVITVALLCVLACLFHQLAVILLLACFIGILFSINRKYIWYFVCISCLLPLVYALVYYCLFSTLSFKGLITFVLHDYFSGNAQPPNLKTMLILTPISFFRTFIQVHGYMFSIIKISPFISFPLIVICLSFFIKGILQIKKVKKLSSSHNVAQRKFSIFIFSLLICYLLFAFLSNGNAEFMLIIPFLLIILLINYFTNLKFMLYLAYALLIWNTYFCLLPWNEKNFTTDKQLVDFIHNNKHNAYILKDKPKIENMYLYYYGEENLKLYYYADLNTTSINNILSQDSLIYTDIFSHSNFSRASLSQDFSSSFYGVSYAIDSSSAVSINSLYSKTILYPITKKR